MEAGDEIPTLLQLMFGEAAGTAQRGASPRLLLWCRAFDEWLAERQMAYSKSDRKQALRAWRRLYRHTNQMPWELRPADVAGHTERLEKQGIVPLSVCTDLSVLSSFYRWCAEKGADPECEPTFNPAASVPRPKLSPYSTATLWSQVEVEALLRTLRADRSPMGLREYAFILARSKLCVPTHELQRLQWGQIRVDEDGARVRWRPGAEPDRLPGEVWEAIRDFLAASRRLPTLVDDSYIFPPLANSESEDPGGSPQDWSETHLSSEGILKNLKMYGRLAGIPENKLNLRTLHCTAIRLQLDSGRPMEEIHASAGWRRPVRNTKCLVRALPPIPEEPGEAGPPGGGEIQVPDRKHRFYHPGEGYTHGFFANSHPPEAIQAILAENIQGVDEQVAGLRALGRGLIERQLQATTTAEFARLAEMYTQVAGWLAEMIHTENKVAEVDEDQAWAESFIDLLVDMKMESDPDPSSDEEVRREEFRKEYIEESLGSDPGLALGSRQLMEEIATLRYQLRNTLALAAEAQDTNVYARMVFLYGRGSVRLASLLRREKAGYSRLADALRESIDRAVDGIVKDWPCVKQNRE